MELYNPKLLKVEEIVNIPFIFIDWDKVYNTPFNVVEKDNKKIMQYESIGLNSNHIDIEEKFINKTNIMHVSIKGKYEDELTGFKNKINIQLEVDGNIYNKVTWNVKNGILNVILHETKRTQPEVVQETE